MTTYTCPAGHKIDHDFHDELEPAPICHECQLVATWFCGSTGEAEWTPLEVHHNQCRELQDQTDRAFDNIYFGGDDW